MGVLLKFEWPSGLVGYSDLHPWEELGDASVRDQLLEFQSGNISQQMAQSMWLAQRDAQARARHESLFQKFDQGLRQVKNNFLLTDLKNTEDLTQVRLHFDTIKVKVGRDLTAESVSLVPLAEMGFNIRLDFNAAIDSVQYFQFMRNLDPIVRKRIEYVEDPFPFDATLWSQARRFSKIALDNQYHNVDWEPFKGLNQISIKEYECPFDVLIIKPAKMNVESAMSRCLEYDLRASVTSYMDHPVGEAHALTVAAELKEKYGDRILQAGCLTHSQYKDDIFSAEIQMQGAFVKKVTGTGIGFDHLLESLPWTQELKI